MEAISAPCSIRSKISAAGPACGCRSRAPGAGSSTGPVKRQITLRLDVDIIAWFKARARDGRGYQTDINGALRDHVQRTGRVAR